MSRLDSLSSQVEKLSEQVGPPNPDLYKFSFDLSLFTAEEQERLQPFIAQLEPKYRYRADGYLDLGAFTDEERNELRHWIHLQDALQRQGRAAAAKLRRRFAVSLEELIARFLAIDLACYAHINTNDPIGTAIDENGQPVRLYKANYRHLKINTIENPYHRERIGRFEIEKFWLWVDWYEHEHTSPW